MDKLPQFEDKVLKSVAEHRIELEDTLIDGKENWDVTGVVLKDREVLSTDGVMIIGVGVSHKHKGSYQRTGCADAWSNLPEGCGLHHQGGRQIMERTHRNAVKEKRYDN